ncbi:hypothetical protein HOY82DRAFT_541492 [Tuber indicum]|nr:hypothetical protein HOY82DRAFT_541492 [Tuber indicum]
MDLQTGGRNQVISMGSQNITHLTKLTAKIDKSKRLAKAIGLIENIEMVNLKDGLSESLVPDGKVSSAMENVWLTVQPLYLDGIEPNFQKLSDDEERGLSESLVRNAKDLTPEHCDMFLES